MRGILLFSFAIEKLSIERLKLNQYNFRCLILDLGLWKNVWLNTQKLLSISLTSHGLWLWFSLCPDYFCFWTHSAALSPQVFHLDASLRLAHSVAPHLFQDLSASPDQCTASLSESDGNLFQFLGPPVGFLIFIISHVKAKVGTHSSSKCKCSEMLAGARQSWVQPAEAANRHSTLDGQVSGLCFDIFLIFWDLLPRSLGDFLDLCEELYQMLPSCNSGEQQLSPAAENEDTSLLTCSAVQKGFLFAWNLDQGHCGEISKACPAFGLIILLLFHMGTSSTAVEYRSMSGMAKCLWGLWSSSPWGYRLLSPLSYKWNGSAWRRPDKSFMSETCCVARVGNKVPFFKVPFFQG